jgi:hypothetical protein
LIVTVILRPPARNSGLVLSSCHYLLRDENVYIGAPLVKSPCENSPPRLGCVFDRSRCFDNGIEFLRRQNQREALADEQ